MSWWIKSNALSQRQLQVINTAVNSKFKCVWIKGFAGTGKTLLLLHILERLLSLAPRATFCFITFTNSLIDLARTSPIFSQKKSNIEIITHTQFLRNKKKYTYVFLDEIQDIEYSDLKQISNLSDRLFAAGDYDQQIYSNKHTSEDDIYKCYGVKEVTEHTLSEVFRLTKNICILAKRVYPDANIVEGLIAAKKNSSINLIKAHDQTDENNWVIRNAVNRSLPGRPSAVLLRSHSKIHEFLNSLSKHYGQILFFPPTGFNYMKRKESYGNFNEMALSQGIPFRYIGSSVGSIDESNLKPIVFITTVHSAKGLDFNNVFIPGLDKSNSDSNGKFKNYNELVSQRVLLVAVTRSRENLYLSYNSNNPKDFINRIPNQIANRIFLKHGDVSTVPANNYSQGVKSDEFEDIDEGDFF
ncbi:MAG: AAA family ATPase [Deltaproteobacteria bacterium]|jgi:superfamily I DNA/RNA helicase|nr:AAA family ATPase [Deltaproteobacteria bacterium]